MKRSLIMLIAVITKRFSPLMMAGLLCCALPAHGQNQLPDGNGKEAVQTLCGTCHSLKTVADSDGFTREGWRYMLDIMVNLGAHLPQDQIPVLTEYLAKNFPEKPMPAAVVIPGSTEVSIKEWAVPTPGSLPHDPLVAADGSIWYTAQMANLLGRFDPKTEQFKEYRLKTPLSGPHGLVADKDGNIWFAANFKAYVGKLDTKTGAISEYPMPDPTAHDPHTPIFDQKGTLWFTVQGANMVGRLMPKTGEVKLVSVPTPKARPYGMVVNSKGVSFFAEFGSNKISSIDPQTMEIHEYPLPHADSRPRRLAITPDDVLWYSDYGRGYLGRFDPKTGQTAEWPSPGGPKSQPYGITAAKNIVWYSESNVKPNTVVRFDPKTETFQTWPIPSGGGVVRNMMATTEGNLWLACSGFNRIALVEVKSDGTRGLERQPDAVDLGSPPPVFPPGPEDRVVRGVPGDGLSHPVCEHCPDPQFPTALKGKFAEAIVLLRATIQPNGQVADIQVDKSPDAAFTESAVRTVGRWRFRPARNADGIAVLFVAPIQVTFRQVR